MNKLTNILRNSCAVMVMCLMAMVALCATVNVKAAEKPGFSMTKDIDGNYVIRLAENAANYPKVTSTVVRIMKAGIEATYTEELSGTTETYTVKPGYYYFDESGKMAEITLQKEYKTVNMATDFTTTSPATKLFKKGTFKVEAPTAPVEGEEAAAGMISSTIGLFSGRVNDTVYSAGKKFSGYIMEEDKLSKLTDGKNPELVTGLVKGSYLDATTWKTKDFPAAGLYFKNGVKHTGLVGLKYYSKGALNTDLTGWKKISKKIYYFKKGVAVTGWNTLKSYGKGVKKYKYLFNKKGVLYTDMIKYYGYNKFIQKDIKIITNKTTHNTTFYVKDDKGDYSIPCKTVICATAREKGDTPNGSFRLEKTWNKRWFVYTKTNGAPYRYYQWAVHIKGTPTLFHSSTYRTTKANSLRYDLYNKLGTSCTTHCIRLQAYYAKVIYDIATKTNKKRRTYVQIITSPNEGPFGHVSLTKVKKGTKWDPTDPNKK